MWFKTDFRPESEVMEISMRPIEDEKHRVARLSRNRKIV
jgi:hypothetical protein